MWHELFVDDRLLASWQTLKFCDGISVRCLLTMVLGFGIVLFLSLLKAGLILGASRDTQG